MSTRRRSDDDFAREIQSHVDLEADRLIEEGVDPDDARIEARRRFGNVTTARERFHEAGRWLWLDRLLQDARAGIRGVRRYPVAALVAITSLAAGIGATTVTLTVRDAVFRRPPPLYYDPGQLSRVQVGRPERPVMPAGSAVPAGLYARWRDTLGASIAATRGLPGARDVRAGDREETAPVRLVSPELFAVLGVGADVGRTFSSTSGDTAAPEAVLSHRVWQRLFDGRADAVGAVLWIDDRPYSIIGVMPERFWVGDMSSPVWTPLTREALGPADEVEVIVRRSSGVTHAALEARLQAGLAEYARGLPAGERQLRLRVSGVEGTPLGHQVAFILPYVLATAVLLTLLIACANVAILMIAQWTAREHEIAIRASLGASRGRIVRSLLSESVIIAACGGALGICATLALRGWVLRRGADATFFDVSIDPGILLQSGAVTLLSGLVAGIAPALYETRRLHANPLQAIGGSDRVRQRWRSTLVVLEITVTVALLVVTSAMIDGWQRARSARMGFQTRPLISVSVENPAGVPAARILELLNHLPGIAVAAASATGAPPFMAAPQAQVSTDAAGSHALGADRNVVSPAFFSALGVPVRAGRPFTHEDSASSRSAVVNETLAERLFPGRRPVGERLWIGGTPYEVIGVVADYSNNPLQHPRSDPRIFLPLPADSLNVTRLRFVVRAEGDAAGLVETVRREIRGVAPGTGASAYTFDQILAVMGQEILLGAAPLFPLIATGILLTAAGIYGVLAFAVTRRTRELAVRMAIGADQSDIARLVGAHTVRLVATGATLGIGLTFALTRVVRARGGGGSIFDPEVHAFILPVLIVLAIGVVAAWMPSRRARSIDPAVLLRST